MRRSHVQDKEPKDKNSQTRWDIHRKNEQLKRRYLKWFLKHCTTHLRLTRQRGKKFKQFIVTSKHMFDQVSYIAYVDCRDRLETDHNLL